jgi:hypothetical protein
MAITSLCRSFGRMMNSCVPDLCALCIVILFGLGFELKCKFKAVFQESDDRCLTVWNVFPDHEFAIDSHVVDGTELKDVSKDCDGYRNIQH